MAGTRSLLPVDPDGLLRFFLRRLTIAIPDCSLYNSARLADVRLLKFVSRYRPPMTTTARKDPDEKYWFAPSIPCRYTLKQDRTRPDIKDRLISVSIVGDFHPWPHAR